MTALAATPAVFRKIKFLVRHGSTPAEIAARFQSGLRPFLTFCTRHGISLVAPEPVTEPVRSSIEGTPLAPGEFLIALGKLTQDALAEEAAKRGTTADKLAVRILELVAARNPRTDDNLVAAVIDL